MRKIKLIAIIAIVLTCLNTTAYAQEKTEKEIETLKLLKEFKIIGQAYGVLLACNVVKPEEFKNVSDFAHIKNEALGEKYGYSRHQREKMYEHLLSFVNSSNAYMVDKKKETPKICKQAIGTAANNIQIWNRKN